MPELLNLSAAVGPTAKITQLFEQLELFSEGEPPTHTLFIQGQPTLAERNPLQPDVEQLLLIDPPADVATRFRLPSTTALLFTGAPTAGGVTQLQTQPGGVAHLRIGQHFLDLYSQATSAVIYLPAVGIVCGGAFGSEVHLPAVAVASTGDQELETLRLLAHLVKQQRFQLFIPRIGALSSSAVEMIERLAADVAYLHGVRRVVLPLAQQGEPFAQIEAVATSLLPASRRSAACATQHLINLRRLYDAATPSS